MKLTITDDHFPLLWSGGFGQWRWRSNEQVHTSVRGRRAATRCGLWRSGCSKAVPRPQSSHG